MPKKRTDRVGEVRTMSNNQTAELIAYRSYSDIDVRFSDGYVSTHKSYDNFLSGTIRNPNRPPVYNRDNKAIAAKIAAVKRERLREEHVGEERKMANGLLAKIVDYRGSTDIDILFEDGYLAKGKSYTCFKQGYVKHPGCERASSKTLREQNAEAHIGEVNVTKKGQRMEIIAYRSNIDIDVRFEDGTVREHVRYSNFKAGSVLPVPVGDLALQREGMTCKANDGSIVKLIKYRNVFDIDVQFEDGTVKEHLVYASFRDGLLSPPSQDRRGKWMDEIGTTVRAKCGLSMTLIGGKTSHDVTVKFEDGTILDHVRIRYFRERNIAHPLLKRGNKEGFCGFTKIKKAFSLDDGRVFYFALSPKKRSVCVTPQTMMREGS